MRQTLFIDWWYQASLLFRATFLTLNHGIRYGGFQLARRVVQLVGDAVLVNWRRYYVPSMSHPPCRLSVKGLPIFKIQSAKNLALQYPCSNGTNGLIAESFRTLSCKSLVYRSYGRIHLRCSLIIFSKIFRADRAATENVRREFIKDPCPTSSLNYRERQYIVSSWT